MRVSEFFKLGRSQPYLDFVDIPLDTDLAVFVDPTALRTLTSPFGQACASLVQHYFEAVLARMKDGRHAEAIRLVSCLSERNEFHLGLSKGRSRGQAFGSKSAESVWGALAKSQASKSGLLKDLEDTCLMIDGIGHDMVSDAVCNIIRRPLIKYTQDACGYYGIPLTPDVDSGPMWDPETETWQSQLLPLPVTSEGKIILVPKIIARHRLSYEQREYYRHYLLPIMQEAELAAGSALVEFLTDGTQRVTKKALIDKYGASKLSVVEQTIKHPQALEDYREAKLAGPPPLDHEQFSELEETPLPPWDALSEELRALGKGQDFSSQYEDLIERILTAVFYPSLCSPTKQHQIHAGRKRIDITYTNDAKGGFFSWLAQHYPSAFIFVECKNYGREIGNPELDQLSGRFSPSRGKVGLLVCRSVEDQPLLDKRCLDTANDGRGFVLTLTDDDIIALVESAKEGASSHRFPSLMRKFRALVA